MITRMLAEFGSFGGFAGGLKSAGYQICMNAD